MEGPRNAIHVYLKRRVEISKCSARRKHFHVLLTYHIAKEILDFVIGFWTPQATIRIVSFACQGEREIVGSDALGKPRNRLLLGILEDVEAGLTKVCVLLRTISFGRLTSKETKLTAV